MYNTDFPVIFGVLGIFVYMLFLMGIMAFAVVAYIFEARGFSAIAKNRGIAPHWLAWIPGANIWLIGSIADHYDRTVYGRDRKWRKVIIGMAIGTVVFATLISFVYIIITAVGAAEGIFDDRGMAIFALIYSLIALLSTIPMLVIEYIVYYKVMASCAGAKAKGFIVLAIFVPFALPFLIFSMRNKTEGLAPKAEEALPDAAE